MKGLFFETKTKQEQEIEKKLISFCNNEIRKGRKIDYSQFSNSVTEKEFQERLKIFTYMLDRTPNKIISGRNEIYLPDSRTRFRGKLVEKYLKGKIK